MSLLRLCQIIVVLEQLLPKTRVFCICALWEIICFLQFHFLSFQFYSMIFRLLQQNTLVLSRSANENENRFILKHIFMILMVLWKDFFSFLMDKNFDLCHIKPRNKPRGVLVEYLMQLCIFGFQESHFGTSQFPILEQLEERIWDIIKTAHLSTLRIYKFA